MLLRAKDVARAAEPKIRLGQLKAVGRGDKRLEPFSRFVGLRIAKHATKPGKLAAADPAAKLMELGEAKPMAALDRHQRGVRHVDADLDHRGANQHLDLARAEAIHDGVLFGRGHAAVDQAEAKGLQFAVGQAS